MKGGGGEEGGFARSVREAAAALVPNGVPAASPPTFSSSVSASSDMGPPPPPPSSVSIGKKPMGYQQAAAPPAPRSARAQAKAPVTSYPQDKPKPLPNNKIWSTSSSEERERIRDFWLALAEDERRDLVKVEKDTVLRKMKEQQKHSCSCAVCGRKRNAIEEELQVLYDAYYEDLEQYALYQQQYLSSNRTLPPPPGPGPFPGSVEVDRNGTVVAGVGYPPAPHHRRPPGKNAKPRKEELDVYEEEEEPSADEDEDDPDGEDGPPSLNSNNNNANPQSPQAPPAPAPAVNGRGGRAARGGGRGGGRAGVDMKGKITAGVGAGVGGPGSILTVADDLLKNDGQKFLEMMEQLAERRMQREEEAAGGVSGDEDSDAEMDGEEEEGSVDGAFSCRVFWRGKKELLKDGAGCL
ncbi:salt tolerance down-regulator-domain-containing protein [Mycena epipterygia]|nr:salt tolerance down-regulator-domain-containing protein [Mycena epipterygia]